jgi:ABC-2 type transport system permease protein/sodium transport system permease protein
MIPFALLFSAIMVAVCSFARTFKEAQNYMMPVIIAAMIPAFGAALPSVALTGIMQVVPVANMVLLTRELFQQTFTWGQVIVVLLSTTLYAAAAVAVAAKLFGQEVVLFADAGSYKTLLRRRHFRPMPLPSASQALLVAALFFPLAFYAQSLVKVTSPAEFLRSMAKLGVVEFGGLFVFLPLALAVYFRIDVVNTFRLRLPPLRAWLAALLIGVSSWALAHEFLTLQTRILPLSEASRQQAQIMEKMLSGVPVSLVILLLAIMPALCEEFFFRGFVLSGLSSGLRKWPAIAAAGAIFAIYHFLIDRVPVTFFLGVMLAYVCWQSRSLLPGILVHMMHNSAAMVINALPGLQKALRLSDVPEGQPLPAHILIPAAILFAAALVLVASIRRHDPLSPKREQGMYTTTP